jgi:hypothetical protein
MRILSHLCEEPFRIGTPCGRNEIGFKKINEFEFELIQRKCNLYHPPGNEIYRKDTISFFEIDGRKNKV